MRKLFARKGSAGLQPDQSFQPSAEQQQVPGSQPPSSYAPGTIGYLCGSGVDDWARLLELCEGCSQSQKLAEETVRALRKEIEHGSPEAQRRAARLLVIISRNTTDRFKLHVASKKFLEAVDKVYKNKNTQPAVKEALLKSFSVLSYEFQGDSDLSSVTNLYNFKLKRPEDPLNGSALDASDPTFDPVTRPDRRSKPRNVGQRDLWKEAEMAKSSANMLSEALAFTPVEDLDNNELIKEFYHNCQRSQSVMIDALPHVEGRLEGAALSEQTGEQGPTQQQELYQKLVEANQSLTEAFKMYDDSHRHKRQAEEEKLVQERSRTDVRMNHNGPPDPYSGLVSAGFAQDGVGSSTGASTYTGQEDPPRTDARPASVFYAPPTASTQLEPAYYPAAPVAQAVVPPSSPPRSVAPLQQIDTNPSPLRKRLSISSRNPYAPFLEADAPPSVAGSPTRLASKNPYATLSGLGSTHSLESLSAAPSSPVEAAAYGARGPASDLAPISEDRNPFHALPGGLPSPVAGGTPQSYRTHRTVSEGSSILVTPTAPSDKAQGKRRQVSIIGDTMEDAVRQAELERMEEERIKARYAPDPTLAV